MPITPRQRLLQLRLLALRNASIGYEPHQEAIRNLLDRPITKLRLSEARINALAWRYRAQIGPEFVPYSPATHPPRTGAAQEHEG